MKKIVLIATTFFFLQINAYAPINLFRPSDAFLIPPLDGRYAFEWSIGYEGTLGIVGFQDNDENCFERENFKEKCNRVNVLQLYQNKQNMLAAFKGFDSLSRQSLISQLFNKHDENKVHGFFVPCGCLSVPMNLMFAARYNLCYGVTFAFYLPVYIMELKNVTWTEKSKSQCFRTDVDFPKLVHELTDLNLGGWRRTGIGDLLGQILWTANFPQAKPLLSNVEIQMRLGVNIPTGLKQNENILLGIPFGNDGSWGIQAAGDLKLTFCDYLRGGIDAEFLYLFGSNRCQRIQTNCNQTDLLLLTKSRVFREYGLSQQYNVFLETFNFCRGMRFKLYYQYLKRNEDRIFLCNERHDSVIANNAQNLQDWTAHSLIFGLAYDFNYNSCIKPSILGWFKWGFNGKRALLANTLGFTFTLDF